MTQHPLMNSSQKNNFSELASVLRALQQMQNAIWMALEELDQMSSIPFMGVDAEMEKLYSQKMMWVEEQQKQLAVFRNRHLHLLMIRPSTENKH